MTGAAEKGLGLSANDPCRIILGMYVPKINKPSLANACVSGGHS